MKQPLILGVAGSIRSRFRHFDKLNEFIMISKDHLELSSNIESSSYKFSNSDIALAFAMLSVRANNISFKIISILELFTQRKKSTPTIVDDDLVHINNIQDIDSLKINEKKLNDFFHLLRISKGIVLSSPVYFGDRSSIANKFMQLTNKEQLLKDKVFSMIATGAKRNGGQETTCIYGLFEALSQGAVAVGNGPATSQYGGTVVAGDLQTALEDNWGIERCIELGHRVSSTVKVINNGIGTNNKKSKRLKIKIIITMDTPDKYFHGIVKDYFNEFFEDNDFEIIDLIDFDIFRCAACNICPSYKKRNTSSEHEYSCSIHHKDDSMQEIVSLLKNSDCLIFVGVNTKKDIIYRYQAFTERTRFMRRDDFQLTNTPILSMYIDEVGSINNTLHNLKILTSYIRHNTILLKPVNIILEREKIIYKDNFNQYLPLLNSIANGRENSPASSISYKATGYSDSRLNDTSRMRR